MYDAFYKLVENTSNFMYSYLLIILLLAALKDYAAQRKDGLDPAFKASSIGLRHKTDFWN